MKAEVFHQCQQSFPSWQALSINDFTFDAPKGFSSFTMGIRAKKPAHPSAVLYRRLAGKENALLDFEAEKEVFLILGKHNIAAHCYQYENDFRLEAFYQGRTLQAEELFVPENLQKIASELFRFHQISPPGIPKTIFWDLLFVKWGALAQVVLEKKLSEFPAQEQKMGEALREIYHHSTLALIKQCLPESEVTFCHNDTYHGNIMKLENGDIKLLDFEFSCLNHKVYDFSNLFAETVMQHQQKEYPYFRIAKPRFGDRELGMLLDYYLDHIAFASPADREQQFTKLLVDTKKMLLLSDFKYALAAIPLALEPIQKIRFLPYAFQRFQKFKQAAKETGY